MTEIIQVGDRVIPNDGYYEGLPIGSPYNIPRSGGLVTSGGTSNGYIIIEMDDGKVSPPLNPKFFTKVVKPVVTKNVQVSYNINPGVYGYLHIQPHDNNCVLIGIEGMDEITFQSFTPDKLREAISILTEIAEAMEYNQKEQS